MAQFDIYPNPDANTQQQIPYLLDIQAELLSHLTTRVVAPLYQKGNITNLLQKLNPTLTMNDDIFVLSVGELAAVPQAYLGTPIANAYYARESIIAAIDLLITGT